MPASCSGHKCGCAKFQLGARKPETCGCCHHRRNWHYDSDTGLDSEDDHTSGDSDDDDDDDSAGRRTTRPSTSTKNKRTVSSLAADLVEGGEYSGVDVDVAKGEAKAGLMKQQVGSNFCRPWP